MTTARQRRVMESDEVEVVGFDERARPVVRYRDRTNQLKTKQSWALTRDGEPTEIAGTVTPYQPPTAGLGSLLP